MSGDSLYYDEFNRVSFPAGTVLITETKAPTGYSVNPTTYFAVLTISEAGAKNWTFYSQSQGAATSTRINNPNIIVGQDVTDVNILIAEAPLRADITFTIVNSVEATTL